MWKLFARSRGVTSNKIFGTTLYRGLATTRDKLNKELVDTVVFIPERIRNFSIIAHVDHGKTTLSTKLLLQTGTIPPGSELYLDKLQVEKERGITVKAQTCTIKHTHKGVTYMLNLIDTPGHVDFNYEVTRSLLACQGALLVVDASQGVQAQTLANFWLAFEQQLAVIPVINKIDLPGAIIPTVQQQLRNSFDILPEDILLVSAKAGIGIENILTAIVERIPPPQGNVAGPLKVLLFDNWFNKFKGVICLVSIVDGVLKKGDKIVSAATAQIYEVIEVGIMHPEEIATEALYAGQVGYVVTGMRSCREAHIGDTFFHVGTKVAPLPGFKPAKPMVFAGVYPMDASEFDRLRDSIEKLTLNDASVIAQKDQSTALGMGYRCGFLGLLHMDVFMQRLDQEYNMTVIATPPSVPYKVVCRDGTELEVSNPSNFPDEGQIAHIDEPIVAAAIVTPPEYIGAILTLCLERRGVQSGVTALGDRTRLQFTLPLSEVITNFYDTLKSITSGYASFEYEESGYSTADLVKLNIMINGDVVDALSTITHKNSAYETGRAALTKLKNVVPRQLFQVALQASIGAKIIARETISAMKKDVLAKCYGGDITRKRKLLDKQKEGKKKLKQIGNVELPQEAFIELLKK